MKVTLPLILFKLKRNTAYCKLSQPQIALQGVRILDLCRERFERDTLYISDLSPLSSETLLRLNNRGLTNLLAVSLVDSISFDHIINRIYDSSLNLVIMNESLGVARVLEEVQDILACYNYWSDKLLETVVMGKGLQEIVNIGHEMIGNPMLILDTSLKVLAYTQDDEVGDQMWKEIISRKQMPAYEDVFCELVNVLSAVDISPHPLIVQPRSRSLNYPYLFMKIMVDNLVVGYLSIIGSNRPLKEADVELATYLSRIISLEMQKHELVRYNKGINYQYFLTDLLEGKISSSQEIEHRSRYLNWSLKKNLYIFTVKAHGLQATEGALFYIHSHLTDIIHSGKSTIYEGSIVTLIDTDKDGAFNQFEREKLAEFLKERNLVAGLSQRFHNPARVKEYYRQSLRAIEVGLRVRSSEVFFNYDDYIIYHVMDILARQKDIRSFCHPSLFKLMEYDKEKQAHLTDTLRAYLAHGRNQALTAKVLHVHRATLIYRLQKIESIMNIDLNDNETLFHLQLSFKLLDYASSLDTEKISPTPSIPVSTAL
ncbi:MAG: PucR family transcriptional regulator [Moorellaceae bacterium]